MKKLEAVLNMYLKQQNGQKSSKMINAAANIKRLINHVDSNVEVIPENNAGMLTELITSLKGMPPESEELAIIREIIDFKSSV